MFIYLSLELMCCIAHSHHANESAQVVYVAIMFGFESLGRDSSRMLTFGSHSHYRILSKRIQRHSHTYTDTHTHTHTHTHKLDQTHTNIQTHNHTRYFISIAFELISGESTNQSVDIHENVFYEIVCHFPLLDQEV